MALMAIKPHKRKQVEETTTDMSQGTEHNQNNSHGEAHITPEEDWNVVQGKKSSVRATSPPKKDITSPTKKMATGVSSNQEHNRFLSLSNLDGESNVSAEEIASTTALVISSTDAGFTNTSSGDQHKCFSSIHQLDKSFLARMQSTSAKIKPSAAGPSSKVKATHKNRST